MPVLTATELDRATVAVLAALGAPDDEARLVARHLVNADLRGVTSHGVRSVVMLYAPAIRGGTLKPGARVDVVKDGPSLALMDGNLGFGQVVCSRAMELAIAKAGQSGMGFVGVVNSNHAGSLADYGLMAVEAGLVGFMVVNCNHVVVPFGGTAPVLGTNPICFAAPTGTAVPMVLDMATSVVAWGKIAHLERTGRQADEGMILDADGKPTTDPAGLIGPPPGAMLPIGGYKGYGLGLMVDILAGALTGNGCSGEIGLDDQGVAVMAIAPEFFGPPEAFTARIAGLVGRIKACPRAPGCDDILLPGEREQRLKEKRLADGIPFDDEDWADLERLAAELGLRL